MEPTFTEEWFSEASQGVLAELVRRVADEPGRIIEIGSWEGRSTIALANATDRPIHAVDTWQGSPGEISAELAGERDVFATWKANMAAATKGNAYPFKMGWREYVGLADAEIPVALLFIDAEHTYKEVADCIDAFRPLMAPDGIICGDDQHHPPVRQAVVERLPWAHVAASLWIAEAPTLELAYQHAASTPSDINEHLPVFAQLVLDMEAKHVIELGTRTGVSTYAWLLALEHTGGRLTSVDIDPKPPIGDYDHWQFIQGDDLDPEVYAQLEPADIVFIDTSHHYQHTRKELALYKWLVKPGGVIVLHDTELMVPEGAPLRDPHFPVKRAVEEFCEVERRQWTNHTNNNGLGVIQL